MGVADRAVRARQVVLASGGFEWNERLRAAYLPFPVRPISAPSNEGDGLRLGLRAGASVADMTAVWGVPVICAPAQVYDGARFRPHGQRRADAARLPRGQRGGRTLRERGRQLPRLNRVFGTTDPRTGRHANAPAWLVFDQAYRDRYAVAGSPPGTVEPWMTHADTLAELAASCGIDAEQLAVTVAEFTRARAAAPITASAAAPVSPTATSATPRSPPNPRLAPLDKGPYYAVPIHAGVLGTAGWAAHRRPRTRSRPPGRTPARPVRRRNCSATVFHDVPGRRRHPRLRDHQGFRRRRAPGLGRLTTWSRGRHGTAAPSSLLLAPVGACAHHCRCHTSRPGPAPAGRSRSLP